MVCWFLCELQPEKLFCLAVAGIELDLNDSAVYIHTCKHSYLKVYYIVYRHISMILSSLNSKRCTAHKQLELLLELSLGKILCVGEIGFCAFLLVRYVAKMNARE